MTKGAKNVFWTYKTAFLSSAAEKLYPESVLPQKKVSCIVRRSHLTEMI